MFERRPSASVRCPAVLRTHPREESDRMVKARSRIGEHVKVERLHVKVDGLVIDKELAEERQVLTVKLHNRMYQMKQW